MLFSKFLSAFENVDRMSKKTVIRYGYLVNLQKVYQ